MALSRRAIRGISLWRVVVMSMRLSVRLLRRRRRRMVILTMAQT